MSGSGRQFVMKRPRDIFAKCITWQDFAAYLQGKRFVDATEATPQTNLLGLPPELLLMIVDVTEKASLANMRLTCRKLEDVTNEAFRVAFLTTRYVRPSESSINALLKIVRDPVFGRYVREIEITSDFLYSLHGGKYSDRLHAFPCIMPRVFRNIQNRHGSVDLVFYEHPNGVFEMSAAGDLAEVIYVVTKMVKQSQCTLRRVWLSGLDWREECSEEAMKKLAEADGWKEFYQLFG
ncbi:hypothetical protein KCU65_g2948, partial [Aureobasidium melanogenum]